MSNSNIKVIAIIATIVLVFTLITSNAVSVASVIFLAKGTTQTGTVADTNNDVNVNTNNGASNNTNTPANNSGNTAATQAPSGNTAATQAPAGNNNSGSTATTAPAGNNNSGAAAQSKSNEEVLKIYTDLMNKAKADKPGYKKVEYQELPSDSANRVISKGEGLIGTILKLVDSLDLMTSKETAEADPEIVEKGSDMRWFPVYKCEKGCYLTDVNAIESTKYEDLGNGKARITIELKDESNPEPMAEGATTSPSNVGAMFSPLSKADIDNTINGGAVQAVIKEVKYSLVYHDCKAVVEYDTNTNQIIRLEQYMNVAIQGGGKVLGISEFQIDKQELFNTMIISDLQY